MYFLDAATALIDLSAAFGGGGSGSGGGGGGGFSGGSGGSGGSSGGGGDLPFPVLLGIFVLVGVVTAVSGRRERQARAERRARARAREDTLWQKFASIAPGATERNVESWVATSLVALNRAWSQGNPDAMHGLLTPEFHDRIAAILEGLAALGRKNAVGEIRPTSIELVEVEPANHGSRPRFSVDIVYQADDRLLEGGEVLTKNGSTVHERWTFVHSGEAWLLAAIRPSTTDERFSKRSVEQFARDHGLHYSADFGRMLLPTRGVLFSSASVSSSDVNNHVIGHRRGQLVQLYTYVAEPVGDPSSQAVVAQAVLPRQYNDILVRPRVDDVKGWSPDRGDLKGLVEYRFESIAFNEKWVVHAHPGDDVAAFELLHPAFLEHLTALPHTIGIEATGHFLYVFDQDADAAYDVMLDLLDAAFDELEL